MSTLEFPNISHKNAYLSMLEEWKHFEAIPTAPERIFVGTDYEDFLRIITNDISNNENGVNSHLFFFMQDDSILGAIQVRHHIDHPNLKVVGGHIGYGIRPSERRKGYAKEMLRLALSEARKIGLKEVLITCDDDNIGSYKTIEANGGVFEYSVDIGFGKIKRRYWITL